MFFPSSAQLPFGWHERDNHDGDLLACLHTAFEICAQTQPEAFRALIAPYRDLAIDEVQGLIAEGYAAGMPRLAVEAAEWLLADPRRLRVGAAYGQDQLNVGRMIYNWSTRVLLSALAPVLDHGRLDQIRELIEGWTPYAEESLNESVVGERRQMRRWAEDDRTALLYLLPPNILSARRHRQVVEAVAEQPRVTLRGARHMASFVRSPMSETQMAAASDEEIFRILDEMHDGSGSFFERRSHGLTGGVSQLSQAFGAFAKQHPNRAIALVRDRFQPGRHEHAAGALLRELGGLETASAEDLLTLVRTLDGRGFASSDWRRDAAWAMQGLARRRKGAGG